MTVGSTDADKAVRKKCLELLKYVVEEEEAEAEDEEQAEDEEEEDSEDDE